MEAPATIFTIPTYRLRRHRSRARPETPTWVEQFRGEAREVLLRLRARFLQQNVIRIANNMISQIRAPLELWPTLVEICYFQRDKEPLPKIRVRNKPRKNGQL